FVSREVVELRSHRMWCILLLLTDCTVHFPDDVRAYHEASVLCIICDGRTSAHLSGSPGQASPCTDDHTGRYRRLPDRRPVLRMAAAPGGKSLIRIIYSTLIGSGTSRFHCLFRLYI